MLVLSNFSLGRFTMKPLKLAFLSILFLLTFLAFIPFVFAGTITVPTNVYFGIPAYGTYINFSTQRTFNVAYREGTNWLFNNYWFTTDGTNATIQKWFEDNWLNYTVYGAGTQKTFYTGTKPSDVYLNGAEKEENDGWAYFVGTTTITGATANASLFWGGENNPPEYGTSSVSTTRMGETATFSCAWTDDSGLSYGKLGHNITGSWQNQTVKSLAGFSDMFIDTAVLPSSANVKVGYRFYANDTSNQWSSTPILTLTTTSLPPGGDGLGVTYYALTVAVVDENDVPQPNVEVSIVKDSVSVASKTSDLNGQARFALQRGNYTVTAETDLKVGTITIEMTKDEALTIVLRQRLPFGLPSIDVWQTIRDNLPFVFGACTIVGAILWLRKPRRKRR